MPNHFLLQVGDGIHFNASSSKSIWGIDSKNDNAKSFIKNAKKATYFGLLRVAQMVK